jgi:hypothetical protein
MSPHFQLSAFRGAREHSVHSSSYSSVFHSVVVLVPTASALLQRRRYCCVYQITITLNTPARAHITQRNHVTPVCPVVVLGRTPSQKKSPGPIGDTSLVRTYAKGTRRQLATSPGTQTKRNQPAPAVAPPPAARRIAQVKRVGDTGARTDGRSGRAARRGARAGQFRHCGAGTKHRALPPDRPPKKKKTPGVARPGGPYARPSTIGAYGWAGRSGSQTTRPSPTGTRAAPASPLPPVTGWIRPDHK